ncbi:MAG: undecaprenyl-diphosphate phosphatase, partial [Planctomycetaceae bacterium]
MLGVVQGIAEFLPISSSGHLVLAESVLGLQSETNLAFNVALH